MKTVFRYVVMGIICGSLIVGYYYYLSHHLTSSEEVASESISELDRVLTQDFKANYPNSPREVVRWYNRIISLYYAQDLSKSELEALCDQAMLLMDVDLLAQNPRSTYIQNMRGEIMDYKARGRKIISTDVGDSAEVKTDVVNGEEVAYVTSYYLVTEGSDYNRSYQTYVLRMDQNRNYKILGYEQTDENGKPL